MKIRLGWKNPDDFLQFIPVIEQAGAQLITLHGRTKEQGYSGVSDWERIRQAKEVATVPLLANGDVHEPAQVAGALRMTGADGVLIARGALGNPWFFRKSIDLSIQISCEERVRVVLEHAKKHIAQYGERGMLTFRKHLSWYFKTNKIGCEIPGMKEWRGRLVRVCSYIELVGLLDEFLLMAQTQPGASVSPAMSALASVVA